MALTVLIADDDDGYRKVLKRLLETYRREFNLVGEARDGEEAIWLAQELHPEVVLMDIAMPGLDGLEATRRIKAMRPETKVVILTIHNEEAYRKAATNCGADGFVQKKSVILDLQSTVMWPRPN